MRVYRVWNLRKDQYLTTLTGQTHWNKKSYAERDANKALGSGYTVRCFKMKRAHMEGRYED